MNNLSAAVILCTATLLAACGGPSKPEQGPPAWIEAAPVKTGHLYGVGSADFYNEETRGAKLLAKDKARLEIARTLRVEISGETYNSTELADNEMSQTLRNTVLAKVPPMQIDGIEIKANYVDTEKRRVYALAHLNRIAAAAKIRRRLADIDLELNTFAGIDTNLPTLKQLRRLIPAMLLLEERRQLHEQHRLISEVGHQDFDGALARQLYSRIQSLLSDITVGVQADGGSAMELAGALKQQLTEHGLTVAADGQGANLIVQYELNSDSVNRGRNYFVFIKGGVSLIDTDGQLLRRYSAKAKGVSSFESMAHTKAIEELSKQLTAELSKALING